jgi:glutathione synthase/RimK-type ligase-like ATP-grasp enzyme
MYDFFTVLVSRNPRLSSDSILIGKEISATLGLNDGDTVFLFVGKLYISLKICLNSGKSLELSPANFSKLHLTSACRYGISIDSDGLHIGPVVGIMAESGNEPNRPFQSQSLFISELITAGKEFGEISYAFNPENVNLKRKTITGYTYESGGWKKGIFPIPDVVYPRSGPYSPYRIKVRDNMLAMGCKFLNPPAIGKWRTYQILSENSIIKPYLPDTQLLENFRLVDGMVRKYGAVYIKPIIGSQGKNIIKVIKRKNSSIYEYQYQHNYMPRQGVTSSISNLGRVLKDLTKQVYIVQKNINLLQVNEHLVDIRVMVQKDHTGEWSVTGKACRIGRRGAITSNISAGGSGSKVSAVLEQKFNDPVTRERIIGEIDFLALEVAQSLETCTTSIGELGIDIGVDNDGCIWFIEANLKPARHVFVIIGENATRRQSVQKPMLYARYLAGFSQER